eukprot:scaffold68780_cov76-Phaeocystis_antarctica.AAC.3
MKPVPPTCKAVLRIAYKLYKVGSGSGLSHGRTLHSPCGRPSALVSGLYHSLHQISHCAHAREPARTCARDRAPQARPPVLSLDPLRPPARAVWQHQPVPIVVSLERRVLLQRLHPAERHAAPQRLRPAAQLGHVLARAVSERDAARRRAVARRCRVTRRRGAACCRGAVGRERELLNPGG